MVKISALPADTAPTGTDYTNTVDAETNTTKKVLLSDLAAYLYSNNPYPTEGRYDFIASGGVWSGDSYAVNKNASMTAMVLYINGRRISIAAVTARVFTASKDTYIDVLDNTDGTGTLVYTEVANNAASPALAANSVRVGIVVTGATTIAAATSINQGQEDRVLPIASSIPYQVTDSLGNLIYPADPNRKLLGQRLLTNTQSSATTGNGVQITGLSVPFLNPNSGLRKLKITTGSAFLYNNTAGNRANQGVWDGVVGSGTQLLEAHGYQSNSSSSHNGHADMIRTLSSGLHTLNGSLAAAAAGTANVENLSTTHPIFLRVELE